MRVLLEDASGDTVAGIDVTEAGTTKRLAIYLVRTLGQVAGVARLGPDPLAADFTPAVLAAILDGAGSRRLKSVLRDQSIIAGIGNAYSDEILHAARISPFASASALSREQRDDLYAALRAVLLSAVATASAAEPETLKAEKKRSLAVHGRTGLPCPACGTPVAEVPFADSSLQYCPRCQTGGRVLADRRMSRLLK